MKAPETDPTDMDSSAIVRFPLSSEVAAVSRDGPDAATMYPAFVLTLREPNSIANVRSGTITSSSLVLSKNKKEFRSI